jgi:hypothetical protein
VGESARQPADPANCLPLIALQYVDLVASTGKMVREGSAGAISSDAAPILARLNMTEEHRLYLAKHFHLCDCVYNVRYLFDRLLGLI